MEKIINYNQTEKIVKNFKDKGKKIIFKSGCFDILHIGHVRMFQKAKNYADILIVGVGSDKFIKEYKNEKTIFDEKIRAEMISALSSVDYVVILNEDYNNKYDKNIDHSVFLEMVRPNYYFLPPDDKAFKNKKKLADFLNIDIIAENNIKIINHSELIEPHSKILKNIYVN